MEIFQSINSSVKDFKQVLAWHGWKTKDGSLLCGDEGIVQ